MPLDYIGTVYDITLRDLMPGAPAGVAEEIEPIIEAAFMRFGMNTPQRQAAVLASLSNEGGQFTATKEISYINTPYDHCVRVFGQRMPPPAVWESWKKLGPEEFYRRSFDHLYDDRKWPFLGLGNLQEGDGHTFVGRGGGITGRHLYTKYGDKLGFPLVDNPDLLLDPHYYIPVHAALWQDVGNNERVDRGDILGAMKKLNSGLYSFDNHLSEYRRILQVILRTPKLPPATRTQAVVQAATGKTGLAKIAAGLAGTTITVADVTSKLGEAQIAVNAGKGFLGTFLPSPATEIVLGAALVLAIGFGLWRYSTKLLTGEAVSQPLMAKPA